MITIVLTIVILWIQIIVTITLQIIMFPAKNDKRCLGRDQGSTRKMNATRVHMDSGDV